jgi:predicted RNA-binding Zn ribbon-like protein
VNADRPPFAFGGRLSLDLTWTLRYRHVSPTELIDSPDSTREWLLAAGLPAPGRPVERDVCDLRQLREAVYRAACEVIDGRPIGDDERRVVNRWSAVAPPVPSIDGDASRRLDAPAGDDVGASLSVIARDAVEVLTLADGRLRRCAGPQCSLLFHDSSRPGARRWCDTARCGNRVNTRSYRRRRVR